MFVLSTDPSSFELTGALIAAIVIGGIVGIVILCCVLGTIVDCVMHVYKYWCNCLHKAYHYQAEMVSLRGASTQTAQTQTVTPSGSEPAIPLVVVRAIPPNYNHVVVSCDSSSDSNRGLLSGSSNNGYRAVPARSPTEARLPPSYSSLFRNDYVTYVAETEQYHAAEAFLAPPR